MVAVCLLFFLLTVFSLEAQELSISAEIEQGNHIEYQPLRGMVSITHNKDQKVDQASFRIEGKPLKVELIQETSVSPSSPLLVSFFRFTLPGQIRGLHELRAISVQVGNNILTSIPSTYVVGVLQAGGASSTVVLNFENIVDGSQTLFPGQRIRLGYRYTYSGSIELTTEKLPLLDAEGLQKIGAKNIKDFAKENLNVREITQEVQATKPGTFTFGPSSVQGYAYTVDANGRRTYLKPQVQAGTLPVTVTVKPFPDKDRPPSFNGAVGPFDLFKVSLLSSPNISVGDKIILSVEIGGKGQLENVPLPELCCQPGFSGLFSMSDLPPSEQAKGPSTKQFTVEMRVLSASVKQLPPVEFAYFDPEDQTYKILRSQPIPLTVTALPPAEPAAPIPKKEAQDTTKSHGEMAHALNPIEIEGIKPLVYQDLQNPYFSTWKVFYTFPIALLALLLQLNLYKSRQEESKRVKPVLARDLMEAAMRDYQITGRKGSPEFFKKMKSALLLRLKERGVIRELLENPEALPHEGIAGKVREFLLRIEEQRFSGKEQDVDPSIQKEAESLYKEI